MFGLKRKNEFDPTVRERLISGLVALLQLQK